MQRLHALSPYSKQLHLIFLGFLLATLVGCQQALNAEQHLEKAQTYFSDGKYTEASIEARNALQKEPDNALARSLLGKLHMNEGKAAAAEKELKRARELDPTDLSVTAPLIKALVQQGKSDQALLLPLDGLSPVDRVDALASQGLALLSEQRYSEATARLSEALAIDPASSYALTTRARLAALESNFDEARSLLRQTIQLDDNNATAWELLGDIEWDDNQLAAAEQAFGKALEARKTVEAATKAAQVMILQSRYDEAQELMSPLTKRSSKIPAVHFIEGLAQFRRGRYVDAQSAFDTTLALDEDYAAAVLYLSQTHLALDNKEQALQLAQRYYNIDATAVTGRKQLARVRIALGQHDEAERILNGLIQNGEADSQVVRLLATLLFETDRLDDAIAVMDLLGDEPLPAGDDAVTAIAGDELAGSATNQTQAEGSDGDDNVPLSAQAGVSRVLQLIQQNQLDEAVKQARSLKSHYPESVTPLILEGRVLLKAEKVSEARRVLEQALVLAPGNTAASGLLSDLALSQGDSDEGRRLLQQALVVNPGHLRTLISLAVLEAGEQNTAEMVRRLEMAIEAHPKASEPRIVLARHLIETQEADKALQLLRELDKRNDNNVNVLSTRMQAHLATRQYSLAKQIGSTLVSMQPEEGQWRYLLAEAFIQTGDAERALIELQSAAKRAPDSLPIQSRLARLSIAMGREDVLNSALSVIEAQDAEHPELAELRALAAQAQSSIRDDAPESSSRSTTVFDRADVLSTAKRLWKDGERSESIQLLEQWLTLNPDELPVRLTLASAHVQLDQIDAAMDQYRDVLEIDSENAVALNNLAWYLRSSYPVEALGYASKARELSPESASTLDTLAVVQLENDLVGKALISIDEALLANSDSVSIRFHHSQILVRSGRTEEAATALKALLEQNADFPERRSAESLLAEIQGGE